MKNYSFVLGLLAILTITSTVQAHESRQRKSAVQPALNILKRVASHLSSLVVYVPPVVRECTWELTCLVTDNNWSKCGWYVIRCVSRYVSGITSCLYDLGGDVAINVAFHGENFWEYDYGQIIWDVLSCAGVDEIVKDFGLEALAKLNK